jgi:ribosome-binding factor A
MGSYDDTKRSRRVRRDRTPGLRSLRLEELIREEMNLLLESEVTDPNLRGVRISAVSLSLDGARARLFYSMKDANPNATTREVEASLQRATSFFRRELCNALLLKRTPELRFAFDVAASASDESEEVP